MLLSSLFIYPIKSCRGTSVPAAELGAAGLRHDREWLVVTEEGRFLTQREVPRLACIVPAVAADTLEVEAPGMPRLALPLDGAAERPGLEVTVWRDRCLARDEGTDAARWFSEALGRRVKLVRFDPSRRRPTDAQWSRGLEGESRFSDGYPLLVLSQASLDGLNARLPEPLPVDRFRPNLLIDGCMAHAEDGWRGLHAGSVEIALVKPCTRCVITTTNQLTGEVAGEEPLRTLRAYRWDARLRGIAFGQNGIVARGSGATLRTGMRVEPIPGT